MPQAIGLAIGELLFTIGAPLVVVNFAVFTLGAVVLNLGISLGLSVISAALARKANPLPKPSDGQAEIRQALSPRVMGFGQIRVSGTVWWLDAKLDVLYLGLALNHGRIGSFVSWHIDSNVVDIDGTDKVTTSPYSANNVFLHHRLGLATETKYSEILTAFGVDNMRGDGVATILATIQNPASVATFQTTYPNGRPTIRATIQATVVWDPRDPAQVRTDPTTWQWSENAVVCLLFYMLSSDGYGIPWDRFASSIGDWRAAADVCDEAVPTADGNTIARYRLGGQCRLTDNPVDVVNQFCSTFDGTVWPKRDGSIGVTAGKFTPPSVTIKNGDVVDYDLTLGQDPLLAVEGVRAQFMSPDYDYREHEAEPWPTGEGVLELTDDRVASLDLTWVPGVSQARRLMKRAYIRAHATRGTITTNFAGLRAIDERFIGLQIAELGIDGPFEVLGFRLDPDAGACELDVATIDPAIDDWDATTEEGSGEGGTLGLVGDPFTKVGTTINLIGEVGAKIGQVAYIFASNGTGTPATPTGFTLVDSISSPPWTQIYRRLIDGTEAAVTVNSANGAIVVLLFQGMPGPSESGLTHTIRSDTLTLNLPAQAAPYIVFAVGVANSDFDDINWVSIVDASSKVALGGTRAVECQTGLGVTMVLKFLIYTFDSTPVNLDMEISADRGTNTEILFAGNTTG